MAKDAVGAPETTAENAATNVAIGSEEPKLDHAARIVRRYAAATAAAGLIPIPWADMTAISAVQTKMVHALGNLYGVPFSSNWAKSLLASLTGSVAADGIGRIGLGSLLKMVPVVGHAASMLALPGVAWVATSTLGQIFVQHFETGGTLLNLDLKVWRPVYQRSVQTAAK